MPYLRKEQSTNSLNQAVLAQVCVLPATLERLSARWKMPVLYAIQQGQQQFSLLKRYYPTLSEQVLSKRLRELEGEGLVIRQLNELFVPPQVHYSLTPKAQALLDLMGALCTWEELFANSPAPPAAACASC